MSLASARGKSYWESETPGAPFLTQDPERLRMASEYGVRIGAGFGIVHSRKLACYEKRNMPRALEVCEKLSGTMCADRRYFLWATRHEISCHVTESFIA